MTESEWLAFDDPWHLLRVRWEERRSGRKLRLFSVACCRRGWSVLADPRSRRVVEAHELLADRRIDRESLNLANAGADEVAREKRYAGDPPDPGHMAAQAVNRLRDTRHAEHAPSLMSHAARGYSTVGSGEWNHPGYYQIVENRVVYHPARIAELKIQADLFRDIFHPFHRPTIDPSWLAWDGGTVPDLARSIYESRGFDRMPILADALEEAGCNDTAILDHCRRGPIHARGCWVVDQLTGRA